MSHKILIAEDEKPLLKILVKKFSDANFQVFSARNGLECLDTAFKEHPDLILLDNLMPEMNGITVLKKLREDSWGKNVSVIILTNLSADDKITEEVAENHPSYYFLKTDIKLNDLMQKVNEILDNNQQ